MNDRNATEPRTEAGRNLLQELSFRENYLRPGTQLAAILAIEAEAAQGAAPRAEGLDVERLAEWFHDKWESRGIACWHKNQHMASWDCGRDAIEAAEYARLSRPSDERVPESEER